MTILYEYSEYSILFYMTLLQVNIYTYIYIYIYMFIVPRIGYEIIAQSSENDTLIQCKR